VEDEPLYPGLTLFLYQLSSSLKNDLISHYFHGTVVNTAVAGETVEEGLGQLMEFQLIVEDAAQKNQPSPSYCPLNTSNLVDGTPRQAEATLIAAD